MFRPFTVSLRAMTIPALALFMLVSIACACPGYTDAHGANIADDGTNCRSDARSGGDDYRRYRCDYRGATYSDTHAFSHRHPNSCANPHAHRRAYSPAHGHADSRAYRDANAGAYANAGAHGNADTHSYANPYAAPNIYAHSGSHANNGSSRDIGPDD